jgi:hypothetical protein
VTGPLIDVWDDATFDPELANRLRPHVDLVVAYYRRDQAIFLSHDLGRGPGRGLSALRTSTPARSRSSGRR